MSDANEAWNLLVIDRVSNMAIDGVPCLRYNCGEALCDLAYRLRDPYLYTIRVEPLDSNTCYTNGSIENYTTYSDNRDSNIFILIGLFTLFIFVMTLVNFLWCLKNKNIS